MLISKIYVERCFVNFGVIFWDVWEEIVFLKGFVTFREILEKLVDGHPNSPLTTWGALALRSTVCWCFKNNFLSPIPSLNHLKFHSNSG